MFIEVIPEEIQAHLETLSRSDVLTPFYMAGGTGLALQLGHRRSYDLDFFTTGEFEPSEVATRLGLLGHFVVQSKSSGTLHGLFNHIRLSFFAYPYPLLKELHRLSGISIADPVDIGCMEIDAISSRGSRKDFIDLYVICLEIASLEEMLGYFEKKYKGIEYKKLHILKSLIYFDDAEQEPMPLMLKSIEWVDVREFFSKQVRSILRRWGY